MKESRIKELENKIDALSHRFDGLICRVKELENVNNSSSQSISGLSILEKFMKENKWGYRWDNGEEVDWSRYINSVRANWAFDNEWTEGDAHTCGPKMSPNDIENELIKLTIKWYKGAIVKPFDVTYLRHIPVEPDFIYDYNSDTLFESNYKIYERGKWAEIIGFATIKEGDWQVEDEEGKLPLNGKWFSRAKRICPDNPDFYLIAVHDMQKAILNWWSHIDPNKTPNIEMNLRMFLRDLKTGKIGPK